MYQELTREEVLALKDGDECYIMSSYGLQKCIYPKLGADTHRNLFWSERLTELGYQPTRNKTPEMVRDWGPIFKKETNELDSETSDGHKS